MITGCSYMRRRNKKKREKGKYTSNLGKWFGSGFLRYLVSLNEFGVGRLCFVRQERPEYPISRVKSRKEGLAPYEMQLQMANMLFVRWTGWIVGGYSEGDVCCDTILFFVLLWYVSFYRQRERLYDYDTLWRL